MPELAWGGGGGGSRGGSWGSGQFGNPKHHKEGGNGVWLHINALRFSTAQLPVFPLFEILYELISYLRFGKP